MKKEKRKCNAFVEKNSARCENYVFGGTSYCFSHYPKKEPIVLSLLLALLTFIFSTILFSEPISNTLSKIPLAWYWVDHQKPIISEIIPNIEKFPTLDKDNKSFKIVCSDKGSGLNGPKCFISIYDKNDVKRKPFAGKLNKSNRELSLDLDKNLKSGEYLLEISLIDKANNKTDRTFSFIVREDKDLVFSAWYKKYEESQEQKTFAPFIENNKVMLQDEDLYVYYLRLENKDNNVILKDLDCDIHTRGAVVWSWKELKSMSTEGARLYQHYENSRAGIPDNAYMNLALLKVDRIGTEGFITFAILVGINKLMPHEGIDMRHAIELWGQYFSEGYGTSEVRKIEEDTLYLTKGN